MRKTGWKIPFFISALDGNSDFCKWNSVNYTQKKTKFSIVKVNKVDTTDRVGNKITSYNNTS